MSIAASSPRLGDWLLEHGHLTRPQLDLALREQQRSGALLGTALVRLGFVSPDVLSQFLAQKQQTQRRDLFRLEVNPDVLQLVPEELARRVRALPLSREGDLLTVAVADPLDVTLFDLLERTTGLRVTLVAATEGEIEGAIERLYQSGQTVHQIVDELLHHESGELAGATEDDAPMIRLADRILAEAVVRGASDIHLHPEDKLVRLRMRCDGVLDAGQLVPKQIQPALTARLKIMGGMDIAETRRTQDGRGSVVTGGREIGLRFSSLPTAHGESLVIRLLDPRGARPSLSALGFRPALERTFCALLDQPHGVILVTGPTGSGKTTTLYTALRLIDGAENSVFTLEDPIESPLPLVRQTQINEATGLTFGEGLRTLLRQDPDVILVGETRDRETAELMIRAALTGHLVFSTLHTNDALGALPRLLDLGIAPYLLPPTLRAVLSQRLVRRICPACAVASPESEVLFSTLHLPRPTEAGAWRRGSGCPECNRSGHTGRVGIHELFKADPATVAAMVEDRNPAALLARARADGFTTMLEDGVSKAWSGVTTLEEVLRTTGS